MDEEQPRKKVTEITKIDVQNWFHNDGLKAVWLVIYFVINVAIFFDTYAKYAERPVYNVLKEGVTFARGCGALLKFNCALILLPVCRNFLTWLRGTFINHYMPIDSNIEFHKLVSYVILVSGSVHTMAHMYNFTALSKAGEGPVNALIGSSFPEGSLTPGNLLWGTLPGFTGLVICLVMLLMYSSAWTPVRRPHFEAFWYTHHLFIVFHVCLLLHGAQNLLEAASFYWWFMVPGFMYLVERIVRAVRARQSTTLVQAYEHPSRVLEIRVSKPAFKYHAGMYLFLCCPYVAKHEWHPFTITSSPDEPFVSVHIRMVGDFTKALGNLLIKSEHAESIARTSLDPDGNPILQIDGGFGTASAEILDYPVSMLVGAGIGVTPFASILKHIRYVVETQMGRIPLKKVYFFWINRDKEAFEWFQELLSALEVESERGSRFLAICTYLTGKLSQDEVLDIVYDDSGEDTITGLKTGTNFGRPNWTKIFNDLSQVHYGEDIGCFFCGPPVLAKVLYTNCVRLTMAEGDTKFTFHKENF